MKYMDSTIIDLIAQLYSETLSESHESYNFSKINNNTDNKTYFQEYYELGHTYFIFEIYINYDRKKDLYDVLFTIDIDEPWSDNEELADLKTDAYHLEVSPNDIKIDDETDVYTNYDELLGMVKKIIDGQLIEFSTKLSKVLIKIEETLSDSRDENTKIMNKSFAWVGEDNILVLTKIAKFDINDIPNILTVYGEDMNPDFLPISVKDIFLF